MVEKRIPLARMIEAVVSAVVFSALAPSAAAQPMQYEVLHAFDSRPVRAPHAGLLRASDGAFYGALSDWTSTRLGAIYRYTPRDSRESSVTIVHRFSGPDGSAPYASLIEGPGGALYGTTYFGGANGRGTIYRYDLASGALTTLHSFDLVPAFPQGGLLLAADGMLYGAAGSGGLPGAFFRFDLATSTLTVLHAYGQSGDGGWPVAAPMQAADGRIYGTAGVLGPPVIYRYDPATGAYATVHAFVPATGYHSYAPMIQAADGFLYGTTIGGGTANMGVIFRFDPVTSTYTAIHHFDGSGGSTPYGALHQGQDGALYGATDRGGSANRGTLYRHDLATGTHTVLEHFDGEHGASPRSALIDAGDGTLLGTAVAGGTGLGTIYRYEIATADVTTAHRFRGTGGARPSSALVDGGDGGLYGTTFDGGLAGEGTLFRYPLGGGPVGLVHGFGGLSGSQPLFGVVRGADGGLYGTTSGGGRGTIFRYDAPSATLATLHTFTGPFTRGPAAGLMQASDGALYGTTLAEDFGPHPDGGTIFRFDLPSGSLSILYTFWTPEAEAASALIQGADGALYGTTSGRFSQGAVFRFDPSTSPGTLTRLHQPLITQSPAAAVLQGSDGALYGTTAGGGSASKGTAFRYDLAAASYAVVHHFSTPRGSSPLSPLIQGSDGSLYGTTQRGGLYDKGTVYRLDPRALHYTILHHLGGGDGAFPEHALYQGADGAFYGTTVEGGPFGGGVLFRLRPGTTADQPASRATSR